MVDFTINFTLLTCRERPLRIATEYLDSRESEFPPTEIATECLDSRESEFPPTEEVLIYFYNSL